MADPTPGAILTPPAAAPAAAVPAQAPKPTVPAAAPAPAKPAVTPPVAATPAPAAAQVPLASLMEEREKRQALQAELENLKTTVQQIQGRQQAPVQATPAPDMKAELEKLWQSDPRKAVQTEIMMATQWMDNVNAQVDGEATQLASKYQDFNNYRDTAMRYVRALPLDQRARPGIVEMAYLVTRGQNVDQILATQQEAMRQRFISNPAEFQMPAGSSASSMAPAGTPQATEAEVRAAGAMKVPIADYLKWKK